MLSWKCDEVKEGQRSWVKECVKWRNSDEEKINEGFGEKKTHYPLSELFHYNSIINSLEYSVPQWLDWPSLSFLPDLPTHTHWDWDDSSNCPIQKSGFRLRKLPQFQQALYFLSLNKILQKIAPLIFNLTQSIAPPEEVGRSALSSYHYQYQYSSLNILMRPAMFSWYIYGCWWSLYDIDDHFHYKV